MEALTFHLDKVVKAKADDMEDFNGPLDLILSLLSKNKMEIKDIQISLICDQYLDWMARRKALDLDVASEFVAMAAHLVYIKTRMLLSIHDEEAMTEMEQLIASLEEHQRHENYLKIKEIAPRLGERYLYGRDYIVKVPEHLPINRIYRYQHQPADLLQAIAAVFSRSEDRLPPPLADFEGIVGREPYPVSDKASEVIARLRGFGVVRFQSLFKGSHSRSEIVATFLAILELCKACKILLAGSQDDCTVTCIEGGADDTPDLDLDTY